MFNFLKPLLRLFIYKPVGNGSEIARYLTSSNHFSREKNLVKPPAFLPRPNPKTSMLETSVFQVSGLTEQEVLEIGKNVSSKSNKTLYGRALLDIQDINNSGLCLSPDNIPPRHANIVDWPIEKSEQKAFALKLASAARLKLT